MGRYGEYDPHTVEYQIYRGEATHSRYRCNRNYVYLEVWKKDRCDKSARLRAVDDPDRSVGRSVGRSAESTNLMYGQ